MVLLLAKFSYKFLFFYFRLSKVYQVLRTNHLNHHYLTNHTCLDLLNTELYIAEHLRKETSMHHPYGRAVSLT